MGEEEIRRMAAHLGWSEDAFIQNFTRLREDRRGLVLKDHEDGSCILLEDGGCRVHAVKPDQCRGFPNTWRFEGFQEICEARPEEMTEEAYQLKIAAVFRS